MMKRLTQCVLAIALIGSISALSAQQNYSGQAYGMFGVGSGGCACGDLLTAGGGGEAFAWKQLAGGADIYYLWPHVRPSDGIGMFSVGAAWHFVNRAQPRKVVPFLNGGYGLAFRNGSANLWYWGAGINWWFASRAGLRMEFRHYGERSYGFDNSVRFGIAFR
jgi:hypothetical protein